MYGIHWASIRVQSTQSAQATLVMKPSAAATVAAIIAMRDISDPPFVGTCEVKAAAHVC
jgi:hypothetical protein